MKIDIYNQSGEKVSSMELPKEIFEIEFKESLVHQALVRQMANARKPVAHTKTKGEVSGGGRKPFRQKGTGNARQGSITNPHFAGGGVSFGPRSNRNFELNMPKKQRRKALFMALSAKAGDKKIFGLEAYEDKEAKTKNFHTLVAKLPVNRNVLFVLPEVNETLTRASGNLPNVKVIYANYLNIKDLSRYDSICFVGDAIDKTKEIFTEKSK